MSRTKDNKEKKNVGSQDTKGEEAAKDERYPSVVRGGNPTDDLKKLKGNKRRFQAYKNKG